MEPNRTMVWGYRWKQKLPLNIIFFVWVENKSFYVHFTGNKSKCGDDDGLMGCSSSRF
jgi:hypothetical protein